MKLRGSYSFPKTLPTLSSEQEAIRDDFVRHWHERLSSTPAFTQIEDFNHGYPVKNCPTEFLTTLEIGAGLGEHLAYEMLSPLQRENYVALELRQNMVDKLKERFPEIVAHKGDCQARLNYPDGYFDRVIAVHVLEHLPNLPAAIKEMHRLCNQSRGVFSVVIPCEGGLAYSIARAISAQRIFEQRYKQSYEWFIEQEHLSIPGEIVAELKKYFQIVHEGHYPFGLPLSSLNLCIGLTLRPKILVGDALPKS